KRTRSRVARVGPTTPTQFPNADPEAQESHDRIGTSDPNTPSIGVSDCDRQITSRRSRLRLHAMRRRPTSTGPGGVGTGFQSRKRCGSRGPITPGEKSSGKRSAGKPPAPFDEAGAGDVTMGAGLRPKAKGLDEPPDPTVRAPVLDPTERRGVETERKPPRHSSTLPS